MLKLLKTDFEYVRRSKLCFGILLLFMLFTCLTFFMSHNHAMTAYSSYEHQLEFLEKQGADIEEELKKEYKILAQEGSTGTVENPASFYREMLTDSMYSLEPNYAISQYLEQSILFFPIIAVFFGVIWSAVDFRNKTYRNRCLRFGKIKSVFGRQLSGFLILAILMVIASVFAFAAQAVARSQFIASVGEAYNIEHSHAVAILKYVLQYLFGILSLLFYYEIGFTFGNLFKGNALVLILVCVYMFFTPMLYKYDVSNIFNSFAMKVFELKGPIEITKSYAINYGIGAVVLAGIFAILLLCNYLIAKKRSAYI